jgi:LysM repeat protein
MRNRSTRRASLVNWLCLGIMTVLLAGCFQSAGNNLEPTSVDLVALTLIATQQRELSPTPFVTAIPSEGFTPPTLTPIPTETEVRVFPTTEPPTLTPIPTETPTVAITEAVEPTSIPPTEVTVLPELTAAPVVTETLTPSETPSLSVVLPPSPTALPGDAPCMHTVQVGEWLYSIARKYNINPVDLIAVNPGSENRTLQPGDVIRIPNCNQPTPTAVPPTQPAAGGTSGEMPTPIPLIDRVYTVAAGDTLGGIARKFGVTVQMLKDANGLTSDFLRIGQQLKIPESQE